MGSIKKREKLYINIAGADPGFDVRGDASCRQGVWGSRDFLR